LIAGFPSTGYGFLGSPTIYDSKEPVEFRLSNRQPLCTSYNTNAIVGQQEFLYDFRSEGIHASQYAFSSEISVLGTIEPNEHHA
jgi:hypothetical protein